MLYRRLVDIYKSSEAHIYEKEMTYAAVILHFRLYIRMCDFVQGGTRIIRMEEKILPVSERCIDTILTEISVH